MLKEGALSLGINLSALQIDNFNRYMELLIEYNKMFNLTAITEPNDIIVKHFLDSLTCLSHIPRGASMVDVGSGAGFPGLAVAIARDDVKITLIDSLRKRVNFLETVANELSLKNVKCCHARAEEAGASKNFREKFDVATARAVASLNVLAEYCLPLVRPNGMMIAMKGPNPQNEIENAGVITALGGGKLEVNSYTLPSTDITHTIITIKKISNTPGSYPRRGKKLGT